jgi:AcrR family transcriptional regulator
MKTATKTALRPRKTPVQERSTITVEAIAEATIQVLLAVGLDRLTTTRVAQRAGVSVGTLYQYYPNKQALLYAVLKLHLMKVAEAIESACHANRGASVKTLIAAVVTAHLDAKLARPDVSTALYAAAAEQGSSAIVQHVSRRGRLAFTAALAESSGRAVSEIEFVALMIVSAMTGATRAVLEAGSTPKMTARHREELPVLCQAYAAKAIKPR